MTNEIRKDYLIDRWTILATERARRPTDFIAPRKKERREGPCPFCPGNEHMTPPATLAYVSVGCKIERVKDSEKKRVRGWLVRCVPNLYPALKPSVEPSPQIAKFHTRVPGTGYHEVVIESPNHDEHPGVARVEQLELVLKALVDRLKEFSRDSRIRYVAIFRNHRREAGASLSHAHMQVIATPVVPSIIQEEIQASSRYSEANNSCVFCDALKVERGGPRFFFENEGFVAFAPWASVHPYEFWLVPKTHARSFKDSTADELRLCARSIRVCFGALRRLLNDPPYSCGFHIAVNEEADYHWHLEVYPKLSEFAGFEKSTGMFISTVIPEEAAKCMRDAAEEEVETIG